MHVTEFLSNLQTLTGEDAFFTGVPDSQLKPLCDYLLNEYGVGKRHVIAANEGNAVALAAGYHLATGNTPVVYLQNSGEGNIINPVASLLNEHVYGIPCIFVVGWRGEPNVHDEPQHIYQGMITLRLLEDMDIASFILDKNSDSMSMQSFLANATALLKEGKSVAVVVKKGALQYEKNAQYSNHATMTREEVIRRIAASCGDGAIVSTTGKASRELFEIREANGEGHGHDFLTVGSMGHSSSIALGIAMHRPERRVWCIDGDGAALMHMGAMSVIGAQRPKNLVHIVINNGAHDSVGGMPTAVEHSDLLKIAEGCGYPRRYRVATFEELEEALARIKQTEELTFLEAVCSIGSRADLGRPTTTAKKNKEDFMNFLK